MLERAAAFESTTAAWAKTQASQGPLHALRGSLGEAFDSDAPIELHGVASHVGPEGIQARVTNKAGQQQTFVQAHDGRWVERPDLQALAVAGKAASTAPGMRARPDATTTFAIAVVASNGALTMRLPEGLERFNHEPRSRPFAVGDSVQIIESTGALKVAAKGQRLVEDDRPIFGTLVGHDGRGGWKVAVTGEATPRTVSDETLRTANNPTIIKDGTRIYDATFDSRDPAQRRFVDGFRSQPAVRELERSRPGPQASAADKAAWERRAIDLADRFLDDAMKYPMSADEVAQREQPLRDKETALQALDTRLATLKGADDAATRKALGTERKAVVQEIATMRAALDKELGPARKYLALESAGGNIGEYAAIGLGQCRHQALGMQLLLQNLGVDARMTRGAANTSAGDYRGEHMWLEATLSDGTHLLIDPTWSSNGEAPGELRKSYEDDKSRVEDPGSTVDDYRRHITVLPQDEKTAQRQLTTLIT